MRIGYFADGPWSHLALEKIVKDERFDISFIVPRYDAQDPVLKDWAHRLGVDYLPMKNVNAPEALTKLASYGADIFVSMSFDQILKKDILTIPNAGFINCHAGLLPYYRGRNVLNWVLINDEKEYGVTVHYIDEGIDTGDIILQRTDGISDDDDYSTLLDRAVVICADVLFDALVEIHAGTATRLKQAEIHPVGSYCGRRRNGDEILDWSWTSRRIFNFVRAITLPGPCARTYFNDREVLVDKCFVVGGAIEYIGTPGEIVGKQDDNLIVKTGDTVVLISILEQGDSQQRYHIGQRFGLNLPIVVNELNNKVSKLEMLISKMMDAE